MHYVIAIEGGTAISVSFAVCRRYLMSRKRYVTMPISFAFGIYKKQHPNTGIHVSPNGFGLADQRSRCMGKMS